MYYPDIDTLTTTLSSLVAEERAFPKSGSTATPFTQEFKKL